MFFQMVYYTIFEYCKTILKLFIERGVRKSYGQFGEDAFIQALLKNIKTGMYCDVGAYHPVLYSNTYGLYKRGWKGIVIDPNNSFSLLYKLLRPRDKFVNSAVGKEGKRIYHIFSDPAYNTLNKNEAEKTCALPHVFLLSKKEVRVRPLHEILKENNISAIDFLNIDVEGNALEVLRLYDWSIRPRVIAVEDENFSPDNPDNSLVYNFLRSKDYILKGMCGLTLIWKSK